MQTQLSQLRLEVDITMQDRYRPFFFFSPLMVSMFIIPSAMHRVT